MPRTAETLVKSGPKKSATLSSKLFEVNHGSEIGEVLTLDVLTESIGVPSPLVHECFPSRPAVRPSRLGCIRLEPLEVVTRT